MLKITGRQIPRDANALTKMINNPDSKEDVIEFVTSGTFDSQGEVSYICYDETDLSGIEGCKTSITCEPGKITMSRSGENLCETVMEFQKGKRYHGLYATPYGNIAMELLTNDVSGSVEQGKKGKLSIDYDISLKGLSESRNTIDIEILKWLESEGENHVQ